MWELDHTAARSLVDIEVVLKSRIVKITTMLTLIVCTGFVLLVSLNNINLITFLFI